MSSIGTMLWSVDNICLDTSGKMGVLLNAMHDIKK
jgi:hypothetical protein